MTDGQTLFLVLVLLYVFDCVVWVGARTALFVSPWCCGWRVAFAGPHLGNRDGSAFLGNPLPPLGTVFAAHWLPVSLSPDGICSFGFQPPGSARRARRSGNALAYDQIELVETEDKYLLLNGERFAKCESASQARRLARLLGRLRRATRGKRETLLRQFLAVRLDPEPARRRLEAVLEQVAGLRWICLVFFLYLYVALPIVVLLHGLAAHLLTGGALVLLMTILIAFLFARSHRRLCPAAKGERVGQILKMVLCPPAAVRAHDQLSLDAMSKYHPILLSHLLVGEGDTSLAGEFVRDLAHPLPHGLDDGRAQSIVAWHVAAELDACLGFLREKAAVDTDALLAAPQWDGHGTRYCPRCLVQMRTEAETCPDCHGVRLRPVPDASARGTTGG